MNRKTDKQSKNSMLPRIYIMEETNTLLAMIVELPAQL